MTIKKAPLRQTVGAPTKLNDQFNNTRGPNACQDNSAPSQCNDIALSPTRDQENILYSWPCSEPGISALDARRRGVNLPAGRVRSLRKSGHLIETLFTNGISQNVKVTRVAFYRLQASPQRSIFEVPGVGSRSEGGDL